MQQKKIIKPGPYLAKLISQIYDPGYKLNLVQQFFLYNFSLSKIDTYKIKNQQNIKMIGKKSNQKKLCCSINNQPNIKW